MAEPQTIIVQVKKEDGEATAGSAILRHDGDEVTLRIEKPKMELHFNYVSVLEFLYKVDTERKKVKIKQM